MTERDVQAGEMFEDHPELEAFAADLRQAAASAPAPRLGAALAAVLDGTVAPAPSDVAVPARRRQRRPRLDARARLRLVLAGGVAVVAFLIAAAGGGLPQPAQRNVARLADHVGVDLPDGDGDGATSADDHRTPVPSTPPAASPTTPTTVAHLVVPDAVADADAVEDLRDGDDDPSTPGRAEEAPGQVNRPSDDRGRDEEQRDEHQPEDTTKRSRPETPASHEDD